MIPVVMLAIDASALSSLFSTLFRLPVTGPSFKHIPVIYLMMIALRAIDFFTEHMYMLLGNMLEITQMANLIFSLLINISATFIIALKAWCVRVDCVLSLTSLSLTI